MPDTEKKLEVLGAAAKYDICASTAAPQKTATEQQLHRLQRPRRDLPQLYAGRPLRLPPQGPDDQLL